MKLWNKNKPKKEKFPTAPAPRSAEEIKKAYYELRARAGEAQYHVNVLTKELNQLNANMESLNYEMDARQKLDATAAKEVAAQEAKQPPVETSQQ